eukprot:6482154-Amphidinium_carterae.1
MTRTQKPQHKAQNRERSGFDEDEVREATRKSMLHQRGRAEDELDRIFEQNRTPGGTSTGIRDLRENYEQVSTSTPKAQQAVTMQQIPTTPALGTRSVALGGIPSTPGRGPDTYQ